MVFRTSSLIEIILFHKSKICINQRLYPSPHQPGEAFVTLWGFHFASDPFASQWGVLPYPPLFPRNEALSMVHLSLELCEKSRASSKQAGPAVFTVGLGGWRGRLREGPGAAEEEVAMGRAPPKAWNAGEVSRGWCGGNQRSSPGMEQVLLCSPSGIKDVTRLKRLVLALQSEPPPPPPPTLHTDFFWLRTCESGCRSESEGWLPCSVVQRSLFVPEWAPKEDRSMANAQSKAFRSVTACL